MQRAAASGR